MPSYVMPSGVFIGQMVWWYNSGETNLPPCAAFVSAIGTRSISLHILVPNTRAVMCRDGVRHVSDDNVVEADRMESGLWDFPKATTVRATSTRSTGRSVGRKVAPAAVAMELELAAE